MNNRWEICVNSTEFTNGLPFRFHSQHPDPPYPRGRIGNKYIYFRKIGIGTALKLKLADILASSSCFPSGFEPMIFPNDYSYEQLTNDQLRNAISFKAKTFTLTTSENFTDSGGDGEEETTDEMIISEKKYNVYDLLKDKEFTEDTYFGIMDGGVADNQAIDAFKLADSRREENNRFDLFISCDVTSYFMDGYTLPLEKRKWYNKISLKVVIIFWISCMLVWSGACSFPRQTTHHNTSVVFVSDRYHSPI